MGGISAAPQSELTIKDISKHCLSYQGGNYKQALFQLSTTLLLYLVALGLMIYSLNFSYALTLLLAIPTAGLLTRIFIFQHDCGHDSFFPSKKANDYTGRFLSLLTIVPYNFWRRSHNIHHATSGNLDHRNVGGIDTITVQEYCSYSPLKQWLYRFYRNPFILIMLGTPCYILFAMRIPHPEGSFFYEGGKTLKMSTRWKSVVLTDLAILSFYGVLSYFLGLFVVLSVFLPVLILTSWIGGWLFFIQHQFEDTYWQASENWALQESSLHGSSYYELPPVFQWFTGNIGLHHIHHLCSKIPNYKLQECMDARPELKDINKITFLESLKCMRLKLWDENKQQLVTFAQIEK